MYDKLKYYSFPLSLFQYFRNSEGSEPRARVGGKTKFQYKGNNFEVRNSDGMQF